jgi:hypothetical protein
MGATRKVSNDWMRDGPRDEAGGPILSSELGKWDVWKDEMRRQELRCKGRIGRELAEG